MSDTKTQSDHILWTSNEVEHFTGGLSNMPWAATGVCISIEEIQPGDLFFSGPKDNLELAIEKGAAAIVTEQVTLSSQRYPCLKVSSTYEALKTLARIARQRTHAVITCIQGQGLKHKTAAVLSNTGIVHQAGRHFSTSLASLPEDAAFGFFGFSSQISPDIAVMSDPASVSPIFLETMPVHGALIINSDAPAFEATWQQAKRAGLSSIYTYSMNMLADAYFENLDYGYQTITASLNLGGNILELSLPVFENLNHVLTSALILKHSGYTSAQIAAVLSRYGGLNTSAQTACYQQKKYVKNLQSKNDIFRVMNVIHLGMHNKIAMLKNVSTAHEKNQKTNESLSHQKQSWSEMPQTLENMRLIYTPKNDRISKSTEKDLQKKSFQKIVPDVVAPGDFLVFKPLAKASKSMFGGALRLMDVPVAGKNA